VRPGSKEIQKEWLDADEGYCIPPVSKKVRNLWELRTRAEECKKLAKIRNGLATGSKGDQMKALGVNNVGPFAMHHLFIPHFDWCRGAPQDYMHGVVPNSFVPSLIVLCLIV